MKLLRVIDTLNPRTGGPLAGLRALTPVLASLGHATTVVTVDAPSSAGVVVGAEVQHLGPARGSYRHNRALRPWVERHAREFDAIIVHGLWQNLGRSVYLATRGQAVPYFIFPHGMLDPWFRRAYPHKHLKKMLYWRLAEQHVLREAAAVLFTCEEERRLARDSFAPYRCTERVVNYGIAAPLGDGPRQRAAWQARVPELRDRPFLLFLGRIHRKKGLDMLLEAYLHLRSWCPRAPVLVIAGPAEDAAWQSRLAARAAAFPAFAPVIWTGLLEGDAKWGALRSAAAFVLPSHQENFGLAVVEALAVGTPVLLSHQVNIWREIVADGAGMAAPDTAAGITGLLAAWHYATPSQLTAMRAGAARCHAERFDLPAVARSLVATVEPFVNSAPARR
jgi:glycosyltransferase involved in cell wall biosynthesis